MGMYKTILVPHGGTTAGDEALKHAIFIAKSSSAKIIELHILEDILHHPSTFALAESERQKLIKSIQEANEEIKKEMEIVMAKKLEKCKELNIESELKVVTGNPAEEILKVVEENNVDLIIMAKRRKLKGVKKLLSLGSVSRKIVENVACPVMLIDVEKL
jgi:nucleotide-binding universal stress UspA family protein